VVAVLVLVDQFGLIGILIAPPLAAVIQIFASQILRSMTQSTTPQLAQSINTLQSRLQSVQTVLAGQTELPTPQITSLVDRLTQLIARATHE
jgi:predicted PurR-regulated permease PerM